MSRFDKWPAWLGFLLALFAGVLIQIQAATLTLTPTADTTLFETYPDNNFGRFSLVAGTTARLGERSRALVKFNPAASLPQGAVINSVQLTFRVNRVPHIAATSTFDLHRMQVDWGEGTGGSGTQAKGSPAKANEATWNVRFSPSIPWSSPGASAPADFVDSPSASTPLTGSSLVFASTSGLVADVQSWVDNPSTNFGWILITESEDITGTARRFNSRESSGPSLVISYSIPQTPPVINTQPQNQTVFPGESATFSVVASGSPPLNYQWSLNQTALAGATNASLLLSKVQLSDAGSYAVSIANAAGSAVSASASLTVAPLPLIQPATSANVLNLNFVAQAGHNYVVQFQQSLSATNWQTLTNIAAPAASTNVVVSDQIADTSRFYRLEAFQAQ